MNYVRTILITIALLNMHYLYNGQVSSHSLNSSSVDDFDNFLQSLPAAEPKTETIETDNLQTWNNHLELLSSDDQYWDDTTNNPTSEWKNKAFNLAEEILKQDKSLAETLKTDFIAALNKKTTRFLDISNLITEFSNKIDNLLSTPEEITPETKELTLPALTIPEVITPAAAEPIVEASPIEAETSQPSPSPEGEATASPIASGQNDKQPDKDQLKQTWSEQLDKVKKEGKNEPQFQEILSKTYEVARELLKNEFEKENTLQAAFRKALIERSDFATIKELYPVDVANTMYFFDNAIGIFSGQPQDQSNQPYRFPEPSTFEPISPNQPEQEPIDVRDEKLEQLRKEFAEKDANFKAEQEKAASERRVMLAALQKSKDEETLTTEKVHKLAEAQKKLTKEFEAKREKDLEEINAAKKLVMQYTEQLAASQKAAAAAAEKGLVSTFTENLSDWWYGTSAEKPQEPSSKDQEKLLTLMVKDVPHHLQETAKQTFKNFQNTLLSFNKPEFWDGQLSIPKLNWIAEMDRLTKEVVITYQLMELKDVSDFVQNILEKSGKISPTAIKNVIAKIQTQTLNALAEQEREKVAGQQAAQRKKEKKEQIVLAQQQAKAEEDRIKAKEQKRIQSTHTYREEKKQWHNLLNKVAQSKQATPQDNHAHLQEALQKSQRLLQLAGDIPHKNKPAISQKLKQKFSVALLEQQKNGDGLVNVHHHMDLFNKEVNKMLD